MYLVLIFLNYFDALWRTLWRCLIYLNFW
jgi:hypothetical protein